MDLDESGHSEKELCYPQEQALNKRCDVLQVSCLSLLSVFPNLKRISKLSYLPVCDCGKNSRENCQAHISF